MIIKVFPDKQKVNSLIDSAENREKFIKATNYETFPTIAAETYYEIIKELTTAIFLLGGFKTIGENAHKELIDELSKHNFTEGEINLLQDLRIRRNQSLYEGKQVKLIYLDNNLQKILEIISKLKNLLKDKI